MNKTCIEVTCTVCDETYLTWLFGRSSCACYGQRDYTYVYTEDTEDTIVIQCVPGVTAYQGPA